MTKSVQFRRGSSEDHVAAGAGFTGALAEVTVDTTNNTLRVHDATTKGGHELVGVAVTQRISNKDIVAIGLTVSGISTFDGSVNANQGLSVTYGATLDGLNVTGVSTISANSNTNALRITQTGSGNAFVVEDNTNPDATPFVIMADGKVGVGTTGVIKYSSGATDTSTFGILAPTGNDSSFVLKGNNGSTTDGSGQTFAVLVGSGGGTGSGTIIAHLSHNTSGIGTRRNAIRFTDNQIRFEDNASGSVDVLINSAGGGELVVGSTSLTGTASQLLQVNGGAYVSGNVGIGSTNITEKLDVNGNIKTSGNILNALGDRFLVGVSTVTVLTSGTGATYTPPSNLISALVIATGGGGGGGGADGTDITSASGGSGGAAGSTAIRVYTKDELGSTATYTIGAGTAGGSNTGGDSTTGGTTTFTPAGTGTALSAVGGGAGQGTQTAANAVHPATAGGVATGGQINIEGGDGGGGFGVDAELHTIAGGGGASFWGGGGGGAILAATGTAAGEPATAYGSGGGGAACQDTTTGSAGGTGKDGVIFILEFTG